MGPTERVDGADAPAAGGSALQPLEKHADVRVIAFYLPQYYPIPENDRWWGEGFTEWTNVRKAQPNFRGHYQPHVPGELGYYDLRQSAARKQQADLAREHGIHGFCYYYYWFNGKRLLERPLDEVLASGQPDFPFCVCWANENWTRRWDGRDQDILIAQNYSLEDSRALVRSLFPLFRDPRYIRVDGKPLLLIYKAKLIPELAATIAMWREECRSAGFGDVYLVSALTSGYQDSAASGFDALVEFPPHAHVAERVNDRITFTNSRFDGMVFNMRSHVAQVMTMPRPERKIFRCLMPGWDNSARQQDKATTFVGSSPELFGYWLEHTVQQTRARYSGDERLIFVNAWNEWGEGCHLEPDARYGRAYLQAVRSALAIEPESVPQRPVWAEVASQSAIVNAAVASRIVRSRSALDPARKPLVSVVMPAYNHRRFVTSALDSVIGQTLTDLELIVVDDGSNDDTAAIVDAYAAGCASHPMTVIHQPNQGAHAAINRGMSVARGEFVAIINSDDLYAPARLERIVSEMESREAGFAFSGTRFIDDDGTEIGGDNNYVKELRRQIARCAAIGDPLLALLGFNVAISTGNFVFRRKLLERVGGFSALRVCHDWDFILGVSYFTKLIFVGEPLYEYRIHTANTFAGLRLLGHLEVDQVLLRFLADIVNHPAYADERSRQRLIAEAGRLGMTGYFPWTRQRSPSERFADGKNQG